MFKILLQVYFFVLIGVIKANGDAPEVKTDQGTLRGQYQQTRKGRTIGAFTGIPYAEPPVGNLRFKAAVPSGTWTGIFDASKPHASCPQINVYVNNYTVIGEEDCLYLNVYTPKLQPQPINNLLPVMFYIHGGGLMCGNSLALGPKILLDKDVVLVAPNYRLGALGFLSTGDDVVPGNNGFKDQNLALKWVKRHIKSFGGDPNKITIVGQSAGGISAHYHVISPLSKNLFKGAIVQSGTAMSTRSLAHNDEGVRNAKKLGSFLNCPTDSIQDMIGCLKNVDAMDIVGQDSKFFEWAYDPLTPFKPVIEPQIDGAFLTEDPLDIITSGRVANVPIMTGLTSEDGTLKSAYLYNNSQLIDDLNANFNELVPLLFSYHEMAPNKTQVSQQIRQFYLGNRKIDDTTKAELTDMITDGWFLSSEDATVRLHAKYSKQPVYYYLFGYRGTFSSGPSYGDPNHYYGVCHGDELTYLFNNDELANIYNPSQSDERMTDVLSTLWTNFAKTGNPTPVADPLLPVKWKPVRSKNLEYYWFKPNGDMKMGAGLFEERAKFWRNLALGARKKSIHAEL